MNTMSRQDESRPLSLQVVEAVADEKEIEPGELKPLYDAIDPTHLNKLFTSRSQTATQTAGQITFRYTGHRITVTHDGSVDVDPIDGVAGPSHDRRN